jgi:hypothetical protein
MSREDEMNEQPLIESAFQQTIATLYQVFFQAYTAARGNQAGQQQAEDNFKNGILHARHIRERAVALIP